MKRSVIVVLSISAIALIAFAVWKYGILRRELNSAKVQIARNQEQIFREIKEKEALKEKLEVTNTQLDLVRGSLSKTQDELKALNANFASLKESNDNLQKLHAELKQKVIILTQEKDALEARMHSLKELKLAIREVKLEEYFLKEKKQNELDAKKLALGNQGYFVKDGKSVYRPKLEIDVIVSQ